MNGAVLTLSLLLSLGTLSDLWRMMTRDTSSAVAARRGVAEYQQKKFEPAVHDFEKARALRPSPRSSFNVGTARIAAGKNEAGSADLAAAMKDPALRADALYNRGNSALAANALEQAIRDYSDALRVRPGDVDAKHNLELAHLRREQQKHQESQKGNGGRKANQQQPSNGPKKQGEQAAEGPKSQAELDAESLLRAVQQQEQEELSRMRKARQSSKKVGW